MRPKDHENENELYECFVCGSRATDPERRTCGECGGNLRNIGRPRDL